MGVKEMQEIAANSDKDKDVRWYVLLNIVSGDLYSYMVKHGISPESLAQKTGRTVRQIEHILSGDYEMNMKTLSDLALAMGAHVEFNIIPDDK